MFVTIGESIYSSIAIFKRSIRIMATLHGGQLSRVAKQYQIPEQEWLDLSTGIAPFSYPIPKIPTHIWQNLPTITDSLVNAAKAYYQAPYCWPLAGSQQLIEKLPELWNCKVAELNNIPLKEKHAYLPKVGYKEHQQAWSKAGYRLHFYQQSLPCDIQQNSVVVVINPNNPLTDAFTIDQLKQCQELCTQQQALLIIDEAFADIFEPEFSFIYHLTDLNDITYQEHRLDQISENVIVLRSVGKFFGLAGLRIGFVCSSQEWCQTVQENIGPWSINGPALFITEQVLKDKTWQVTQKMRLQQQSKVMRSILETHFVGARIEANALFITVFLNQAADVYHQLCEQGIYVRLTDENDSLRFGIANETQLKKLQLALIKVISH